jgi:DNA invertase Pin-like site-specific DNA recombinase
MQKHTAIYIRVSTIGQDHAAQMPDLERWVAAHDGSVIWYKDKFTGKRMDRPGMGKLMQNLQAGKVERIVVWRLDRLGRTAKGLCELFDDLHERKIDLVSIKDGFSLNTPAGRLHARILASVAEYETEVRAERVMAGQAAARANGKRWGGSDRGRLVKVTEEQRDMILKSKGESIAKLSRTLGLSRPTIYRVLRNAAETPVA